MSIHSVQKSDLKSDNYELLKALMVYLQEYFPKLDIWYVNSYSADGSSKAAGITVKTGSGHIGIGKKPLLSDKADKVLMKVYNVDSDVWTFLFDQHRLSGAGVSVGVSCTCSFGKCNLGLLRDFFVQNSKIIESINNLQ